MYKGTRAHPKVPSIGPPSCRSRWINGGGRLQSWRRFKMHNKVVYPRSVLANVLCMAWINLAARRLLALAKSASGSKVCVCAPVSEYTYIWVWCVPFWSWGWVGKFGCGAGFVCRARGFFGDVLD